jgi:NAD(P)H-hydrate epimerase
MASAGMGDILTGMVAGLIVQGMDAGRATEAAVYLHGRAADTLVDLKGPVGYLASEVGEILPEEIRKLWTECGGQHVSENSLITSL